MSKVTVLVDGHTIDIYTNEEVTVTPAREPLGWVNEYADGTYGSVRKTREAAEAAGRLDSHAHVTIPVYR